MVAQNLKLAGKEFVILSKADFEMLNRRAQVVADVAVPLMPAALEDGNYPAREASRAVLARKLIRRRWAVGLSQVELARAGIRAETLNRIERARVTADPQTVKKIVRVLERAERLQSREDAMS